MINCLPLCVYCVYQKRDKFFSMIYILVVLQCFADRSMKILVSCQNYAIYFYSAGCRCSLCDKFYELSLNLDFNNYKFLYVTKMMRTCVVINLLNLLGDSYFHSSMRSRTCSFNYCN